MPQKQFRWVSSSVWILMMGLAWLELAWPLPLVSPFGLVEDPFTKIPIRHGLNTKNTLGCE